MRFEVKRRLLILPLMLVMAFAGFVGKVEASGGVRGDRCEVAEDEVIVEDFYFFCRILRVRGTIDGDLIGLAAEVTIEQTAVVTGDVWVGGGRLVVKGKIGDDIHFGGVTTQLDSRTRFTSRRVDLVALALNVEIMTDAVLPGDLLMYGYQARVDGTVGGDVEFTGETLLIDGVVSGNIDATVGDNRRNAQLPDLPVLDISFANPGLVVGQEAQIGGNLVYDAPHASSIPSGAVNGIIRFENTNSQLDITKAGEANAAAEILRDYLTDTIRDTITLLAIGLLVLIFAPNIVRKPSLHVRQRTVPAVGWGLVTFILSVPMAIVVIIVGLIVLGILYYIQLNALTVLVGAGILIVSVGMVGGFGFLLFFMGQIVVSFVIGQWFFRHLLQSVQLSRFRRWVVTLALGVVAFNLLTNIPLPALGLIFELIAALAGIGAVVIYIRGIFEGNGLFGRMERPIAVIPATSYLPPTAKDAALPPGMDNLPDGFTGFDENW